MENGWIDYSSQVALGSHVSLNRGVLINAQGGLTVGDWTMIGPKVTIYTQKHAVDACNIPRALREDTLAPVSIGKDCWIATGVMILAGVDIGDGSVVAAGSVVTRSVPSGVLVAGVPARFVRRIVETCPEQQHEE